MARTTPPRPLDVEALFPELSAHRGTSRAAASPEVATALGPEREGLDRLHHGVGHAPRCPARRYIPL
ncbi:hypothetical protein C1I97_09505 [Streptomyces sp. NTH33]|nr:hypothetical protein C1I97_09505 [Streptomyces sp. NTH33]